MSVPEGDYERGKKLFKMRCLQCHVIDSDANKNGPTLKGVIGRKSGTVDGYPYSSANKNKYLDALNSIFIPTIYLLL
ncbi:cytochrome c type-1 [Wuchereria bancrofti]|uniref:Cytochrome c type-1 n=1 Tax=Wuchereria bancrofti TaxID=6293 RepID=J9DQE9_WUCBA|nr:cytochrome c type-1 [Wuchereria bancrofti]